MKIFELFYFSLFSYFCWCWGEMVVRKVGKYEVGRTIGEGTFAKVKFAQNTETGESVAMKVLDRSTIIKHKMADQVILLLCSCFFCSFWFPSLTRIPYLFLFLCCFFNNCYEHWGLGTKNGAKAESSFPIFWTIVFSFYRY